jgi:hypothetical protein
MMTALTREILENITGLPPDMQQEALDFVLFLKQRLSRQADLMPAGQHNGKEVAEIMARIARRGTAFKQVNPVAWQQEVRRDRPHCREEKYSAAGQ